MHIGIGKAWSYQLPCIAVSLPLMISQWVLFLHHRFCRTDEVASADSAVVAAYDIFYKPSEPAHLMHTML